MRKKVWGAMVEMGSRTWELGDRSWIGGERPALLTGARVDANEGKFVPW